MQELVFKQKIGQSLGQVRKILDAAREPRAPDEVSHDYQDKFLLVDWLSSAALNAVLNAVAPLGLNDAVPAAATADAPPPPPSTLARLRRWAVDEGKSVSLRFDAKLGCQFVRKTTRKIEHPVSHEVEVSSGRLSEVFRAKSYTKVTEYLWAIQLDYTLVAHTGPAPSDSDDNDSKIVLGSASLDKHFASSSEAHPWPETTLYPPIAVNITRFVQTLSPQLRPHFAVDRTSSACRTPRRNEQVDGLLDCLADMGDFMNKLRLFWQDVLDKHARHNRAKLPDAQLIFCPVVPLFEQRSSAAASSSSSSSVMLSDNDLQAFLAEQQRCIVEQLERVGVLFSEQKYRLVHVPEATLLLLSQHVVDVVRWHRDAVDYVEQMLYRQFYAAIGKLLAAADFRDYMRFHNARLFRPAFAPRPFTFAVRRPDHSAEGVLTVAGACPERPGRSPVETFCRLYTDCEPVQLPINASTSVRFSGDVHLHGWLDYGFDGASDLTVTLEARAKQFSCFLLVVGTMTSANEFDPLSAVLLKDKDVLEIPLIMELIPTAKAFKRATDSMSPTMQAFAKAFRAMQLQSVFAFCLLQVTPQLERLLNLPAESLVKQIDLRQNIMELLLTYQIPSSLLEYQGPPHSSRDAMVAQVQHNVAAMQRMIQNKKAADTTDALFLAIDTLAAETDSEADDSSDDDDDDDNDEFCYKQMHMDKKKSKSKKKFVRRAPSRKCEDAEAECRSDRSLMMAGLADEECLDECAGGAMAVLEEAGGEAGDSDQPAASQDHQTPPDDDVDVDAAAAVDKAAAAAAKQRSVDWTQFPVVLDGHLERFDKDDAVRPIVIKTGEVWTKTEQTLLAQRAPVRLASAEQRQERNKAFDLLDALTKSGALPFENASLHVVIATAHCFAKSLIETVVRDNGNAIAKVQRSSMIVAATIHETSPARLVKPAVAALHSHDDADLLLINNDNNQ